MKTNETSRAFGQCRKIIVWLYKALIRLRVFYGALVSWTKTLLVFEKQRLDHG